MEGVFITDIDVAGKDNVVVTLITEDNVMPGDATIPKVVDVLGLEDIVVGSVGLVVSDIA